MLIMSAFLALALWLGYGLGYRQGVQYEQRAWESNPETSPLADTRTSAGHILQHPRGYANPHAGMFVRSSPGLAIVNQPDPRVYQQYVHSLP
jgi:hypothetical protein